MLKNVLIIKQHFLIKLTKTLVFATLDTSQLKKINDYKNIYSINPLYLTISEVDWHVKEKNGSKYLVFDFTEESREVLHRTLGWD